jgi:hypothetical protein
LRFHCSVPNQERYWLRNRWHHIAAVMENNYGTIRFYLDGVSRQTINRTATGAASDSGSPGLTIGMESDTRYFTGIRPAPTRWSYTTSPT